ncbi:MAG: branched-chain amino acid ABC transporter permease LivH [Methylobacteriaceae bacterium]|jgi:branched-chain amino acid transport system permease protein|nr:branched-chain amino acid ABC transporter permease LivH [Methylobacteriaceae bacterium]
MPGLAKFLQLFIDGISLGALYAMIAIGYTMVYGIIGMINFAHGEIYMIGAYVGMLLITYLAGAAFGMTLPIVLALALLLSVFITSIYGYVVERIAYRPLRSSQRLIPLISAIGVSFFLQNFVAIGQSAKTLNVMRLTPGGSVFQFADGSSFQFDYAKMLIVGVTIIMMTALTLYIKYSRMGRACRACAQDLKMAALLGVDINRVISFTFVLGAGLAAVGGVLITNSTGILNPFIGFLFGLKAFVAAVLGGIGSSPGAMAGGVFLGVVESMTSGYISSDYKDAIAFGLLIAILLIRPTGLLGRAQVDKV